MKFPKSAWELAVAIANQKSLRGSEILINAYVAEMIFQEAEWWMLALIRENLHPTDMAHANARLRAASATAQEHQEQLEPRGGR